VVNWKVLWKETELPRCRATDSRWNRSVLLPPWCLQWRLSFVGPTPVLIPLLGGSRSRLTLWQSVIISIIALLFVGAAVVLWIDTRNGACLTRRARPTAVSGSCSEAWLHRSQPTSSHTDCCCCCCCCSRIPSATCTSARRVSPADEWWREAAATTSATRRWIIASVADAVLCENSWLSVIKFVKSR